MKTVLTRTVVVLSGHIKKPKLLMPETSYALNSCFSTSGFYVSGWIDF